MAKSKNKNVKNVEKIVEEKVEIVEDDDTIDQDTCKHNWIPAGKRANRDRVHNRSDGKGNYTAYKCDICDKFKRRYMK